MSIPKKKTVRERIREGFPCCCGPLDSFIENLVECNTAMVRKGYTNISIDDVGYDYEEWCFYGDRVETDKEMERRVKREGKERAKKRLQKETKRQYEIKELERLTKKYGNNQEKEG